MGWFDKFKKSMTSEPSAASSIQYSLLTGVDLGILYPRENDYFVFLINNYMAPILKANSTKINESTENSYSGKTDFKTSPIFTEIVRFAKMHPGEVGDFNSDEFEKLKSCLVEIGKNLDESELKLLVRSEQKAQAYARFKILMVSKSLHDYQDYIRRFAYLYGKKIKTFDDFRQGQIILNDASLTQEEKVQKYQELNILVNSTQKLMVDISNGSGGAHRLAAECAILMTYFERFLIENKIGQEGWVAAARLVEDVVNERNRDHFESLEAMRTLFAVFSPDFTNVLWSSEGLSLEESVYEEFKATETYVYIVNFVKRYSLNDEEQISKLLSLLQTKGLALSQEHLKGLIGFEISQQNYAAFEKNIDEYSPADTARCLRAFAQLNEKNLKEIEVYSELAGQYGFAQDEEGNVVINKELTELSGQKRFFSYQDMILLLSNTNNQISFLRQYSQTKKIAFAHPSGVSMTIEELVKKIIGVRKEVELEVFESNLLSDTVYSLNQIDVMDGFEFEIFLVELFKKRGFEVTHTKLSGDQGADLVVSKAGITIAVQAKRCANAIGNSAIQEVVASISHYKAHKGMVITNNRYTPSAVQLAKSNSVELIDRDELSRWIKNYL